MIGLFARLRRDHRGVSAVEFALIAPALIAFYFGLAEFTQAMMAERRASHVAASMGDLVAQSTQISDSTLTDIFTIGTTIMSPFPTSTLKMRLTSVTANSSGTPKVDWSKGSGLTALTNGATVTLPTGLVTAGQSVIMSEVTYVYDSPVDQFIPGSITFTKKFYLRPRKSDQVTKSS
ncbi:Flp pilus assembly protein TadG [Caulobacter ginsengisoli]|uniref:Flp pilus assembly protein TadG n=1 Tax=Caulobacter ginsengisoli TaxID=400775 RepID=A0ABU0IWR9_9CAUL|nr:pilus assembly protein [Caulobacter ginsengisoli]MDQ0466448.1 Flp pilus assembly protein TadG [Caulobacter ginsengisoli]